MHITGSSFGMALCASCSLFVKNILLEANTCVYLFVKPNTSAKAKSGRKLEGFVLATKSPTLNTFGVGTVVSEDQASLIIIPFELGSKALYARALFALVFSHHQKYNDTNQGINNTDYSWVSYLHIRVGCQVDLPYTQPVQYVVACCTELRH